ncbi:hypothetical protein [Flavobacterium terrae]|uniref:Lipoprotein n=1 Tax=Flavobacterium terrae TaxID=415425 RepID=A0A1M6DV19_9FLAO|nr:hypothetical protein [Flavobacterium terrae]SHI77094.1 hypothetical protein SAMN05444363_1650 [Flavobacterium terrae]
MKRIIFIFFLITISCKKEEKENIIQTNKIDEVQKFVEPKDKNIDKLFEQFIIAFNSNNPKKIDPFIDPKIGCLFSFKDGYYPILLFDYSIAKHIDWYKSKIYTTIESNDSPEYLGDLEFKKEAFFYKEYKNKFLFEDFNNDYVNISEEKFESHKEIKNKCNFIGYGISKNNRKIYNFYFSINKNSINLVAIDYEIVSDDSYADSSKKIIPFGSVEEVQAFIEEKQLFEDNKNHAYVDFSKREIIYCDFGDEPIQFSSYKISEIENINSKIKTRTIALIFSENQEDNFSLTLTNKGVIFKPPMGARPPYEYR